MRCRGLLLLGLLPAMTRAQLSNHLFNLAPEPVAKPIQGSVDAFPFFKNNEYFNTVNPGETLFGFRAAGQLSFQIAPAGRARLSAGMLVQENYGGKTLVKPLLNLTLTGKRQWNYIFGTLVSGTRHRLIEPLYNYEQVLTQPIEYGIQFRRQHHRYFYDGWVEWRQQLDKSSGRQEFIIGGQSAEIRFNPNARWVLSAPLQAVIVHQGGQALNPPVSISTRINAAAGLRWQHRDTAWMLEALYLQSLDNSPNPLQPWNNGWATMINARAGFGRYHSLTATWWFAREFFTTIGSPVFSNVNLTNVYANSHTRRLVMLRYVYSRPVISRKIWLDIRLEPHYDLEAGKTEFSHGVFLRYITSGGLKLPRIPGLF